MCFVSVWTFCLYNSFLITVILKKTFTDLFRTMSKVVSCLNVDWPKTRKLDQV